MRISLLALAVAAFGIGTSEFIIMGLLPNLSASFDVSIPKAGLLVSGYAISVTLGSPVVAIATARMERKRALLLLMGVFTLGNFACAVAPTYNLLFAARVLTALCHGAFFGIGSIVAANMVPNHQRSQAIALMFSGLTLANVLGVPIGTALGQAFGWRASFWAIVPIGLAALLSIVALVPPQVAEDTHLMRELRLLRHPQVLIVLALSVCSSVSLFCVLTYITPMLEQVTHISPHGVTLVLLVFGIGITIGNLAGGRLSDWRQMPSVIGLMSLLVAVLAALFFAERYALPCVIALLVWGMASFAAGAPLQARVVEKAHGANLAATLNQGAFNLGNALGASLGGLMINAGWGYRSLPWASAAVTGTGLVLAVFSLRMEKPEPLRRNETPDQAAGSQPSSVAP
jgi:DHA1 family inner membrane transport protein